MVYSRNVTGSRRQQDRRCPEWGWLGMQQMMTRKRAVSSLVGAALLVLAAGAGQAVDRCDKTNLTAAMGKSLPALREKMDMGEPIRVVALGSSSVEGTPDMPREQIFASVMERELARQMLTPVEVVNKGKGGETIPKMVDRIERDVLQLKPDLVVWQLGVNDVLQMDGVEPAIRRMEAALETFREAKLPVVLVDLQVSPLVDRDRDTPAMQAAIVEAGKRPGVMHFHRQAFMRRMIEQNEARPDELVHQDGLHMTRLAHDCTGKLLARQIAGASQAQPVAMSARPGWSR